MPPADPRPRILVRHSSARQDVELAEQLLGHLRPLERFAGIDVWSEARIDPGDDTRSEVMRGIDQAHVALLLLSADFLKADGLLDEEIPRLVTRQRAGALRLIPVVLRPCLWDVHPSLKNLYSLPRDGRPIGSFSGNDRDAVLTEVAKEIIRLAAEATGAVTHLGSGDHVAPRPSGSDTAPRKRAASPPALPFVPFLRNPSFIGRAEELDELHELLSRGAPVGVQPAALTGMGGIGKTQLAVEYAHAHADSYPDGIYWINAAGHDWTREIAKLATRIGLSADKVPESLTLLRLAELFASHLRSRPNALLVLDNVDDPADLLGDDAAGFIPSALGCQVLFTTRRRFSDANFPSIEVRVLPEPVSVDLLLSRRIPRADDSRGIAVEICRTLGHLPLALALASAYLNRNGEVSLAEYLSRIRAEGALPTVDDSGVRAKDLPTRHVAAVAATLRLQWNEVASEQARLALQTAALLGESSDIPLSRLSLLTGLSASAARGRPAALTAALQELWEWSLVEELAEHAVRIHPLVREFALRVTPDRAALAEESAGRLSATLTDMIRLDAEVRHRGVDQVLDDLVVVTARLACSPEAVHAAKRLLLLLDLEAHRLRTWDPALEPGFLLQQMGNRSVELGDHENRARAHAALDGVGWASLRQTFPFGHESPELVRTMSGHKAPVTAVSLSKAGRVLVSASNDKSVTVWDQETGKALKTLTGHSDWVTDVCVSADGTLAVSASVDRTLKVWKLVTGEQVLSLDGHGGGVSAVTLIQGGTVAISASWDANLAIWDLTKGERICSLYGHTASVLDVAATGDGGVVASVARDGTLRIWDATRHVLTRTFELSHEATCVGVAPSGSRVVWGAKSGAVGLVDLQSGRHRLLAKHTKSVNAVAIRWDERIVASASDDGTIRLWDVRSGRCLGVLEGHTGGVTDVIFGANGEHAASTSDDRTVKLWRVGEPASRSAAHKQGVRITGLRPSRSSLVCSVGADRSVSIWSTRDGRPTVVRALAGQSAGNEVALTSDGRRLVAVTEKVLSIRKLESSLTWYVELPHDRPLALSVIGDAEAVVIFEDLKIAAFDLSTGDWRQHADLGETVNVEGFRLDVHGRKRPELPTQGQPPGPPRRRTGPRGPRAHRKTLTRTDALQLWGLAGDGRTAVVRTFGGALRVLDLALRREVFRIASAMTPEGIVLDHDGRFALLAGKPDEGGAPLRFGFFEQEEELSGPLSSDGRHFEPAADARMPVEIWDLRAQRRVASITVLASLGQCAVLSRDGRYAAFYTEKGISVIDVPAGHVVASLFTPRKLSACSGVADDALLIVGDEDGAVHVIEWRRGRGGVAPAPEPSR